MKTEYIISFIIAALVILTAVFAFFSANTEAGNKKVLADMAKISEALEIFHDENGYYPYGDKVPDKIMSYLEYWPQPEVSGICSGGTYVYTQKLAGDDYSVSFCLNRKTEGIPAGSHFLTSRGIE